MVVDKGVDEITERVFNTAIKENQGQYLGFSDILVGGKGRRTSDSTG